MRHLPSLLTFTLWGVINIRDLILEGRGKDRQRRKLIYLHLVTSPEENRHNIDFKRPLGDPDIAAKGCYPDSAQ